MRYELGQFYTTIDKLVSSFCHMYDIDEKLFRQEVADITASKIAHNREYDEYDAQSMLNGVWTVVAAKSKDYEFAILAGSKMAVAPPIPFNFIKNYAPDLRSVFQCAPFLPNVFLCPIFNIMRRLTPYLCLSQGIKPSMVRLYR